jgi:transposase InsO family protein
MRSRVAAWHGPHDYAASGPLILAGGPRVPAAGVALRLLLMAFAGWWSDQRPRRHEECRASGGPVDDCQNLEGPRALAGAWNAPVRQLLNESGIRVVQTPYQAPNANAYAERFVRSVRDECLDRVIPFGERHLRRTLAEFIAHYHRERNHQGLENALIEDERSRRESGRIHRRPRLGGLLNYSYRAA